jgi:hypothetical protein
MDKSGKTLDEERDKDVTRNQKRYVKTKIQNKTTTKLILKILISSLNYITSAKAF